MTDGIPSGEALIKLALEVRERAYAPYSRYRVGAAVVGASGEIYLGCNVENASYGLTVCAERNAVAAAVAAGETSVAALAVVARGGASMCGACRQVAAEFGSKYPVHLGDEGGTFETTTLEKLLPGAFDGDRLGENT